MPTTIKIRKRQRVEEDERLENEQIEAANALAGYDPLFVDQSELYHDQSAAAVEPPHKRQRPLEEGPQVDPFQGHLEEYMLPYDADTYFPEEDSSLQALPLDAFALPVGAVDLQPIVDPGFEQTSVDGNNSRSEQDSDLVIGTVRINQIGLVIPPDVGIKEALRRQVEMAREIERQKNNPPAPPRSSVADLPPKAPLEKWHNIPDSADPATRRALAEDNQRIATINKEQDKHRNNMAAKKSREKRLEMIANLQEMVQNSDLRANWWCLRAISLGAPSDEFDRQPVAFITKVRQHISDEVKKIEDGYEEERKKEESRRRAERNRARAAKQ